MNNKKTIGLFIIIAIGICINFSKTFAESQIIIDPITKTISIINSGTTSTGINNNGERKNEENGSFSGNEISRIQTGQNLNSYTGSEFQQALQWMYENKLTSYSGENYRPNDALTREEATKIISQAYQVLGYSTETKNTDCTFNDAHQFDSTLIEHINNACKRGLFKGHQKKFFPKKTLSRPEIIAVLIRMFEGSSSFEKLNPRRSDYYIKAKAIGITTVNNKNAFESPITRKEMAIYIYRLRNILINQTTKINAINKIQEINQSYGSGKISKNENTSELISNFSALAGSISIDKDPELTEAIRWMNDNELTNYKTIQEYMPFEILTREQAAKILYSFGKIFNFSIIDTSEVNCTFSDIANADPTLTSWIKNACEAKIMKGTNGKFNPKETIKKSEFITAMIRMFEGKKLNETENPRRKNYFKKAQEMGIISPADAITFEQAITRYEVALFLYRFKVKYQMLNALNTNKLNNEVINTVPGSISTGTNNLKQSNIYIDMNLINNGNFELGYIEIFGTRYKIIKSSTEKYFTNNYVRYGDIFDIETNKKIGTINLIVSNGYVLEGTIRLPEQDFLITQVAETNAYYKIKQIK